MLKYLAKVCNDFKMTPDQLEAAITPDTRVLLMNSPSNPCGTMYSQSEVRAFAAVLEGHEQVVVVSDEIYERLVYGDEPNLSMGSLPSMRERVVTINGLSKAFAMTGWRIGYACAPGGDGVVIKAMNKLQSQMTSSITSFTMPAVVAALTEGGEEVERMRRIFAGRASVDSRTRQAVEGSSLSQADGCLLHLPRHQFHVRIHESRRAADRFGTGLCRRLAG